MNSSNTVVPETGLSQNTLFSKVLPHFLADPCSSFAVSGKVQCKGVFLMYERGLQDVTVTTCFLPLLKKRICGAKSRKLASGLFKHSPPYKGVTVISCNPLSYLAPRSSRGRPSSIFVITSRHYWHFFCAKLHIIVNFETGFASNTLY
jgi:hypothetical protein